MDFSEIHEGTFYVFWQSESKVFATSWFVLAQYFMFEDANDTND